MGHCVVCGGSLVFHRPYDFKSASFRKVYSGSDVFRCSECTLSQVDMERVNSARLSHYYSHEYRVVASAGAVSELTLALWKRRADALASLARAHGPATPARVFEVGAGYGANLMAISETWPDARLFTDEVSQVAERDHRIERAELSDGDYDIILLSHVLEHFEHPVELMDKVSAALGENGIVIIEVPNDIDGIERYNGPDEPHLTFFEKHSLKALLDRTSLETVDIYEAGPNVIRKSVYRQLKVAVRSLIHLIPAFSRAWTAKASGSVATQDFEGRNGDGLFLRAILKA